MRLEHKVVPIVADPEAGVRCHVYLLDLYISKLPSEAVMKDLFYCRPLQLISDTDGTPWYCAVPVGRNMLNQMVSVMCEEAGISGKKTNHNLRVAGASTLFDAGVPERIIQGRTGHKSIEALRVYERVTDDQLCMVSKVLSGSVDKFDKVSNSAVTKANTKAEDKVTIPPSVEVDADIADVKPTLPPTNPAEGTSATNYYNCTVNMFQGQGPQSPPYYWQSRVPYQPSLVPYQPFPIYDQFAGDLPYNTQLYKQSGDLPEGKGEKT